jgi:hypothetical protein
MLRRRRGSRILRTLRGRAVTHPKLSGLRRPTRRDRTRTRTHSGVRARKDTNSRSGLSAGRSAAGPAGPLPCRTRDSRPGRSEGPRPQPVPDPLRCSWRRCRRPTGPQPGIAVIDGPVDDDFCPEGRAVLHWRKRRTRRSHAKARNNDNDPLRSAGMEDATLEDRSCAAVSRLRRGPLCRVVRA